MMDLQMALAQLDPNVDDHWTAQGIPRIDAIMDIMGSSDVTRQQITSMQPTLNRDVARARASGVAAPAPPAQPAPAVQMAPPPMAQPPPPTPPPIPVPQPVAVEELDPNTVMNEPRENVCSDPDKIALAMAVLESRQKDWTAVQKNAVLEIAQVGASIEQLKRAMIAHQRKHKKPGNLDNIRSYLKRQSETRLERAQGVQEFLRSGANPAAVVAAMRNKSPLDLAMNINPKRAGAGRPAPMAPKPMGSGA